MSAVIGDPRPAGEEGPAGDQRKAGEEGTAGDPRKGGQATVKSDSSAATTDEKPTKKAASKRK